MKSASGGDSNRNAAADPSSMDTGAEIAFGLLRALSNTAVSVLYQTADLRVAWAQNVPTAWSSGSIVGKTDHDFLPSDVADTVIAAKRAVLSGVDPDRLEICIPGRPGEREDQWFELWIDADPAPDGIDK